MGSEGQVCPHKKAQEKQLKAWNQWTNSLNGYSYPSFCNLRSSAASSPHFAFPEYFHALWATITSYKGTEATGKTTWGSLHCSFPSLAGLLLRNSSFVRLLRWKQTWLSWLLFTVQLEKSITLHPIPPSDPFATFKRNTVWFAKTYKLLCSEKAKKASEQHFFPIKSTPRLQKHHQN